MAFCQKHNCELKERAPKLEADYQGIYDIIFVCPICREERQRFLTSVTRRMKRLIGRNITVEICPPGNHKNYLYFGVLEQVEDLVSSITISGRRIVSFIDQEGLDSEDAEMDNAHKPARPQIVSISINSGRIFLYKRA